VELDAAARSHFPCPGLSLLVAGLVAACRDRLRDEFGVLCLSERRRRPQSRRQEADAGRVRLLDGARAASRTDAGLLFPPLCLLLARLSWYLLSPLLAAHPTGKMATAGETELMTFDDTLGPFVRSSLSGTSAD